MVRFQHLDTYTTNDKITLFGRTLDGKSVAVHVRHKPYFYVRADEVRPSTLQYYYWRVYGGKSLNVLRKTDYPFQYKLETGQDFSAFREGNPQSFYKIIADNKSVYWNLKKLVTTEFKFVESQFHLDSEDSDPVTMEDPLHLKRIQNVYKIHNLDGTVYNDQVSMDLQYFIDTDTYTSGVFEVSGSLQQTTSCDIELNASSIEQVDSDEQAPWKLLAYDLECLPGANGSFPDAKRDPIVTIGVVTSHGQHVWTLKDISPYEPSTMEDGFRTDIEIHSFDSEPQMLLDFTKFIKSYDPDFILGHNVNRFDNPYIFDRMTRFGIDHIEWGRVTGVGSKIKTIVTQSKQRGTEETKRMFIPGRIMFDSYDVCRQNQKKERSYKLDSLAEVYLKTKKIPIIYTDIPKMYRTADGRRELAIYCVKDSWLSLRLMERLQKIPQYVQLAAVTGIGLKNVLERGQGIRSIGLVLRKCKKLNYFVKTKPKVDEPFDGAVVLSPIPGYYTRPVVTIDFASLYPSIMQAVNMCYSTIVDRATIEAQGWVEGEDVITIPDYVEEDGKLRLVHTPTNPAFVTSKVRKGVLPMILTELLAARRAVKKRMKSVGKKDDLYAILDGRQLALKVICNSLYGFTAGYILYEPRIASSVTKYGRGLILQTKYGVENNPVWGKSKCIYGDTDSCFFELDPKYAVGTLEEQIETSFRVGEEMAEYVTKLFLSPILMEFEKTYKPFILRGKKRYVGDKYEPGRGVETDVKGFAAVRRDYAPIVVEAQKKVMRLILDEKIDACRQYVSDLVSEVYRGSIPVDKLRMSKQLTKKPEDYKMLAVHVELAKRLAIQCPETAPLAGDRVDYFIRSGTEKVNQRGISPEELEFNELDYGWYVSNQLREPLTRLLEMVTTDIDDLFRCNFIRKRIPKRGLGNWVQVLGTRESKKVKPAKRKKKLTQKDVRAFFTS